MSNVFIKKCIIYNQVVKVIDRAEPQEPPQPYDFSYDTTDDNGNRQGRQESGDAHGNMKGSYTIQGADGLSRRVEYVADGAGFRAVINTNEPGTDNQNPADVTMNVQEAPKIKFVNAAPIKYKLIKVPVFGHYGY